MISNFISLKNFHLKKNISSIKKDLKKILEEKSPVINSLGTKYENSFNIQKIKKYKKFSNVRIIGMGGSTLGTQAIYSFLNHKIKKKFLFLDNLKPKRKIDNQKNLNLIISKSGNTIETIINVNIFIKKKDNNIFIVENNQNYLHNLAKKLKSEIFYHNNFIGGRYSVLSEVGMLPAELMGLNSRNFKQLNNIVKNKKFLNSLIASVSSTLSFIKKKKFNSIILNYDEKSHNLFSWYQQLISESLGKNNKGLLPVISTMPKDNHSVMQLYLDGFKNNFFTFFYVHEDYSSKINSSKILSSQKYLKNKSIEQIIFAQKKATENVFKKKNIPFRSFEIYKRNEKSLSELFTFFMLETILIGRALKINPFNQPAVEQIKKETKKILL